MRLMLAGLLLCTGVVATAATVTEAKAGASHHALFVWSGDAAKQGNDFLLVLDADPRSPGYGRMISAVQTDQCTVRPHHTEYSMPASGMLFANDHDAGRRSTRDARPFSYDLMADDVVALLDKLRIAKVDVVGWSDGANIGLDLAMRHPARIGKLFAFGANANVSGMSGDPEKQPIFPLVMARMSADYARLSPTPKMFEALAGQMSTMWAIQPNWSDAQLAAITSPVWIVDGDHEEFIKREHTEHLAATIPGAGLLILPEVSHFAPLRAPALFNAAVLQFLDGSD